MPRDLLDDDDFVPANARPAGGKKHTGASANHNTPSGGRGNNNNNNNTRSGRGGRGGRGRGAHADPTVPTTATSSDTTPAAATPAAAAPPSAAGGLLPADRAFHRIMWDTTFAPDDFEVGYEDRFAGVLFMPVAKFRGPEADADVTIPFHRVRKFRFRGVVVWDRDAKVNKLEQLADVCTAEAARSRLPTLRDIRGARLTVLPPTDPAAAAAAASATANVSVANFNVLHDLFDADLIYCEQRLPLIAKELERTNADVIFLQEVTPHFFTDLRAASKALCAGYYWTSPTPDCNTAQCTLSRWPIPEAVAFSTSRNKRCIFAALDHPDGFTVTANCHLLSDFGADPTTRRRHEARTVFNLLEPFHNAGHRTIAAGDFNFGDQNIEQQSVDWCGFVDVWRSLHPPQADEDTTVVGAGDTPAKLSTVGGFTFDFVTNWLAEMSCRLHKYPRRLDRILVRGFTPVAASIFGTTPTLVDGCDRPLFPSDHYGVQCTLHLTQPAIGGVAVPAQRQGFTARVADAGPALRADSTVSSVARQLATTRPHFRTALVVLAPQALHDSINAFRSQWDKAYPRWMPHATILFPFVGPEHFPAAVQLLTAAFAVARRHGALPPPFQVQLNKPDAFRGSKGNLFLAPETPGDELNAIYDLIAPLFPSCKRTDRDGYHPHFSLGQCAGQEIDKRLDAIRQRWTPAAFTVSQVHLIAHLDDKPGYEVMHAFDLSSDAASTANATAAATAADIATPPAAAAAAAAAPAGVGMANVLEPVHGAKQLQPYLPPDTLERWLCRVTLPAHARDAPTHISQLGGMYHVPGHLLDDYLSHWEGSVKANGTTDFYVEELRGPTFRFYVDVDLLRSVPEEFPAADALCQAICRAVGAIFGSAFDTTAVVLRCHGPWEDGSPEKLPIASKTGLRIYFQRLFVDTATYTAAMAQLPRRLQQAGVPLPEKTVYRRGSPGAPLAAWSELLDADHASWARGRLMGTTKRRRHLDRRYAFHTAISASGVDGETTALMRAVPRRVLYATTLRLWDVLPAAVVDGGNAVAAAASVLVDNCFTTRRLARLTAL